MHRSAYQLKEADPHSWAIPRLTGAAEGGAGRDPGRRVRRRPRRPHARRAVRQDACARSGLDDAYGAYLDHVPGVTLATVNLMSLFGLHRRWRGAIVGHLALFEMTSSMPNRPLRRAALRRLGFGEDAVDFFDEHVVADAVHENIAAVDLAGGLARQEPALAADVLWGARALVHARGRWSRHLARRLGGGRRRCGAPLPRAGGGARARSAP